jgi:hypothetical protein
MKKEQRGKETILAAIRRAAAELGKAPSRGELRRITGVSHYRVLAVFPTLREAVRAAGLEPNPKGEKISTEDLLADWKRVAEKLGRRPSRAEYVREGRYSAGALTVRFGRWSGICETPLTTKDTKEHGGRTKISRELTRRTRIKMRLPESPKVPKNPKLKNAKASIRASGARYTESSHKANRARLREPGEFILRDFDRAPLAAVPAPVVGMRRVTEEVAQMVVNTLMGARSGDLVIGKSGDLHPTARNPRALGTPDLRTSVPVAASLDDEGTQRGSIYRLAPRGVRKDRPVMGEPFDRRPLNECAGERTGRDGAVWDGGGGSGLAGGVGAGEVSGLYRQAPGCAGEVAVSAD